MRFVPRLFLLAFSATGGVLPLSAQQTYHLTRNTILSPIPLQIQDGYDKISLGYSLHVVDSVSYYGLLTCFGAGFSPSELPLTSEEYPLAPNSIYNIDGAAADDPTWLELECRHYTSIGGGVFVQWGGPSWLGLRNPAEFNVQRGNHRIGGTFQITYPSNYNAFSLIYGRRGLTISRRMALGYSGGTLALDFREADMINQGETVIGTLGSNSTVTLTNSTFQTGGSNSSSIGEFGGIGRLIILPGSTFTANGAPLLIGAFGGNGTVDVNGLLSCTQSSFVGYGGGTGRVNVSPNKEYKSLDNISVGSGSGSVGTLSMSGLSSNDAKVTAKLLRVGDIGSGTLSSSFGVASVTDHMLLGQAGGSANVSLIHSTFTGGGYLVLGGSGSANASIVDSRLELSAGIAIGGAGSFGLGTGGNGNVTISGNSNLVTSGQLLMGNQGAGTSTLQSTSSQIRSGGRCRIGLFGNASLTATTSVLTLGPWDIGFGAGTGTVALNRTQGTATELNVGSSGANGSLSLTESNVTINGLATMGEGGTSGLSLQAGSLLQINGGFRAGVHGGGTHAITLQNSSTLNATQPIVLGTVTQTTSQLMASAIRTASTLTNGQFGVIKGTGTLECSSLENFGSIDPGFSPGLMTVQGTLNHRGGEIKLELGGPGNSDKLAVSGALNLIGGVVRVVKLPGYSPQIGDQLDLIDAGSTTQTGGSFVDETGLGLQWNLMTGTATVTQAPSTISGQVTLQDFSANPSGEQLTYEVISDGIVRQSGTVLLQSSGLFAIPSSLLGSFNLVIKGRTWLAKSQNIQINASGTQLSNFGLINGDADGDNEVGPGDFELIVSNFGLGSNDVGFDPNADLDRDEEVGPSDFEIVVGNFGLAGD